MPSRWTDIVGRPGSSARKLPSFGAYCFHAGPGLTAGVGAAALAFGAARAAPCRCAQSLPRLRASYPGPLAPATLAVGARPPARLPVHGDVRAAGEPRRAVTGVRVAEVAEPLVRRFIQRERVALREAGDV